MVHVHVSHFTWLKRLNVISCLTENRTISRGVLIRRKWKPATSPSFFASSLLANFYLAEVKQASRLILICLVVFEPRG